jgi:hypothetical protein
LRSSVALAALALSGAAHAFEAPSQFFASDVVAHAATLSSGAEGIYFTGAPRFSGLDCASCHAGGPQEVKLHVGADPPDLFTAGWRPGATYRLEIALADERRGIEHGGETCTEPPGTMDRYDYVQCNSNSFALEVDAGGRPLSAPGTFCSRAPLTPGTCPEPDPFGDEVVVAPGGDAVFASRQHSPSMTKQVLRNGATRWQLHFTAPAAGAGPLTLYVSAVDGNGGSGRADDDQDPASDDTVSAAVVIPERGGAPVSPVRAGCELAGRRSSAPGGLALLALAWVVVARRRAYLGIMRPWLRLAPAALLAACPAPPAGDPDLGAADLASSYDMAAASGVDGSMPTLCKDPRADKWIPPLTKTSFNGGYRVTLVSGNPSPPAIGMNSWTLKVTDLAGQGKSGISWPMVKVWMPDHGHGSAPPQVRPGATAGTYDFSPLTFFHAGVWQLTFTFQEGASPTDQVVFTYCLADPA